MNNHLNVLSRVTSLFSVFSIIWILSVPTSFNIAFCLILSVCLLLWQIAKNGAFFEAFHSDQSVSIFVKIVIIFVSFILGFCFFMRWNHPDTIILVPGLILRVNTLFIAFISLLLMLGSALFLLHFVRFILSFPLNEDVLRPRAVNPGTWVYLLAIAFITLLICSKSSWLYPFNDAPDGNCFFTVGKALANGKVLYRDIVEQKGPFIYFLHLLAYGLSSDTFHGVFFFEVISAFLFLVIIYRSLSLFCEKPPVAVIGLFAALIYSQGGLFHGDEVEEFCLPVIALSNYYLLRSYKTHSSIHYKEFFLIGFLAGLIFWSKYTICGYFVCWYVLIAVRYLKGKRWGSLWRSMASVSCGVLLSTIPVLLYFAFHKAFRDLWEVYFLVNISNYSNVSRTSAASFFRIIRNLMNGTWITLRYDPAICILLLCGFFSFPRTKEKAQYSFLCIGTLLFTCAFGEPQKYYTYLYAAFTIPGILFFRPFFKMLKRRGTAPVFLSLFASAIIAFSASPNTYMLLYHRSDLPQYQFAEIIKSQPGATLLNYGFLDSGYYTVTGIVPDCKYFCILNMELPLADQAQDHSVKQGLTDFVVCRDAQLDSTHYSLVSTSTYFCENAYRTDFLYHRSD